VEAGRGGRATVEAAAGRRWRRRRVTREGGLGRVSNGGGGGRATVEAAAGDARRRASAGTAGVSRATGGGGPGWH
jgi:hypothetical protein